MAKLSILAGATSQSVNVFVQDTTSTTGAGLAGIAPAGGSLLTGTKLYYSFTGTNAASVVVSLTVLATVGAAYSSTGIVQIDNTNMIGWVRIDIPNAALATSKGRVVSFLLFGGTNMAPCPFEVELTGWDNQDAVHGGLTCLPNTAVTTNASLLTSGTGTDQLSVTSGRIDIGKALGTAVTTTTSGILDVNTKNINNVAAATPGASGGILISGSNSGTTTLGALTVTGSATISDGLLVSRSTGNSSAITATGNGTGSGIVATSGAGATGDGIQATSGASNGNGLVTTGVGTGNGLKIVSASGDALSAVAATSGHGFTATGAGTTKHGINATGGATTSHGIAAAGGGAGDGIKATGGATGNAFELVGGGTSGDGLKVTTTSGNGFNIVATGTSMHGITATGGNGGTSDGIKGVAGTGGVDIRGNLTGNVTGNLSGTVGSVTGAVGSVTGAVGSVTGAVGSVTGAVGSVTGNVGGNVTGSVGSLATQAKTDVKTQVTDGLNVDTYAEPGQTAPPATTTLQNKIAYIYKFLRNKVTQTSTTLSVFADDASTVDQKAAVSDDGTTYTRGEIASGP